MKRFIAPAAACACLFLCACGVGNTEGETTAETTAAPEDLLYTAAEGPETAPEADGPIEYEYTHVEYGETGFFCCPRLLGEGKSAINGAIEKAVTDQLSALDAPGYAICEVMYSGAGLFSVKSCAMMIADEDMSSSAVPAPRTECVDSVLPITFDAVSGEQLTLADLFDPENERWRGLIPDIVTLQAEKQEMTLLSDVMPAADDRPFYLTEDALVILYRPYEIATYSAGWPEFAIPLDQLSGLFAPEGPVASMLTEKAAAEETHKERNTEKES